MWGLMITSYLGILVTFILLFITGLQGYFHFQVMNANHSQFALITAMIYMFTQTLIMFYFIGSGTAIKKSIQSSGRGIESYEKVKKGKMLLFPHLTLNMVLVGTVFILGGAVQTGSVSGWIHGILFIISFIHFLYTILLEHRGFKDNIDILVELAEEDKSAALESA